jgi:hypothetical protein
MVETYSSASPTRTIFFWRNTKISIFGGISKFHFWADSAALTVVDSMPQLGLKS